MIHRFISLPLLHLPAPRWLRSRYRRSACRLGDRGQATVEYALILLVAAVIALLVVTWATAGGGAGRIGGFFDSIINRIISKATDAF